MRQGFDRLAHTARERVGRDPVEGGALFVFTNRRATRIKLLWFERNGLCLLYKRLHRAVFELPLGATLIGVEPKARLGALASNRATRRHVRSIAELVAVD